jgi:hypothetical protein
MIPCHYCNYTCEQFIDLAKHINKIHPLKHNKWATKFQFHNVIFEKKNPFDGRVPLTEQEKENKTDSQRVLSGQLSVVTTICPSCRIRTRQAIPKEHTENPTSWKSKDFFMISCQSCRK